MTLATIREDLKDIRYYYMRKDVFDKGFSTTGENIIIQKVHKYNNAIKQASPKLYDLYVSLYIECHTQESLSDKLGFTPEYIQMLNKKLLKFLQSSFIDEKEETAWKIFQSS